jgi:Zn-dependent protease
MPGRSVRIARIAGIPVGVSPWWLVIVVLITWSLGASYFPEEVHGITSTASYALGFASALLLFASILAHEFGHAIVARRHGIEVEEIDLWLLGGVSRMRGEAHEPADELRYALAGPAVTAVIAACFGVALLLLPPSTPAVLRALVEYQVLINGLILVFNLLPAFPLDGGRVLRSLLWRRSGSIGRSTETAAGVGRVFGYLMIVLGGLEFLSGAVQGLWLALIGFFLVVASGEQARGAEVQAALSGARARDLMSTPVVSIRSELLPPGPAQTISFPIATRLFRSWTRGGRAVGLVSVAQIEALTPHQRAVRRVREIADRDRGLIVTEREDVSRVLERAAFSRVGRAVVVDEYGSPVDLLSITDVQRALRASRLGDREAGVAGFRGSSWREAADGPPSRAH